MAINAPALNMTARKTRLFIGADAQDWSNNAGRFTSNKASIEESGVCAYEATLEINDNGYLNPEELNPELNSSRWRPGQLVRVEVPDDAGGWVPHPQGWLYILSEPSPRGKLVLQLGDWLAWGNSQEPSDDVSGVQVGVAEDLSVVCQRLLEAAGIPSANINLGGPWGYSVALPVTKPSGSYIARAGEIAYACDFRVLYQDKAGIVRAKLLSTSAKATPDLTLDLRLTGTRFESLADPQEPFEVIRVAGVGDVVTQIPTPISGRELGTDTETYTYEGYDLNQDQMIGRGAVIFVNSDRTASRVSRLRLRQAGEQVFKYGGSSILVVTGDTTEIKYYEAPPGVADGVFPYRFFYSFKYSEKAVGLIDGDDNAVPQRFLEEAVNVTYDADGRVSEIVETQWEREKAYVPNGSINFRKIRELRQTWEKEGSGYKYTSTEKAARVTISQDAAALRPINRWDMVDAREPDIKPAQGRGANEPPAADEWEGPYRIESTDYEGEVTWTHRGGATGRTRTRVFQLPEGLAFSVAQCQTIAGKERDLLDGRKRGKLIQLPISTALLTLDEPDPQLEALCLDGWTRTYILDSIGYEHQPKKSFAEAAGILIREVAP